MQMFRFHISSSVSVSWPNHSRVYRRYMGSSIEELSSNTARYLGVAKITEKLKKLSLRDDGKGQTSSSSNVVSRMKIPRNVTIKHHHVHHYPKSIMDYQMKKICHYLNNIQPNKRLKEIIKETHPPYISMPQELISSLSTNKIFMGLGFRFQPGQTDFLMHNFKIPVCLDRYKIIYESLRFKLSKNTSSIRDLCTFRRQDGFHSVVDINYYKNLVEVITLYKGVFGRFLILTCTGVSCTVWYSFYPCIDGIMPPELFAPIVTYEPFFNTDYLASNYTTVEFTAANDISDDIRKTMSNVAPLSEIGIPASGTSLRNVGLGILIAFLMTAGVVKTSDIIMNTL